MSTIKISDISTFLNKWAPPSTKFDYDNVGLLVGDPHAEVSSVLTCLDCTEEVVEEAADKGCDLIVAHHPLIFKKISRINPTNEQGRIIYQLIKNNIGLIASHTNLDAARNGVSFVLAETLGLENIGFLDTSFTTRKHVQLTIEEQRLDQIIDLIDEFVDSSFTYTTTLDDSPERVQLHIATEDYLLGDLKGKLLNTGRITADQLLVSNIDTATDQTGMGAIGTLPDDGLPQNEFLQHVSDALNLDALRFSGSADHIQTVAVCGGAGVFLSGKAAGAGADAFVTADIKYHDYFTGREQFLLLDVGHYESEAPVIQRLKDELETNFPNVQTEATECVTNAMHYYVSKSEDKPQNK